MPVYCNRLFVWMCAQNGDFLFAVNLLTTRQIFVSLFHTQHYHTGPDGHEVRVPVETDSQTMIRTRFIRIETFGFIGNPCMRVEFICNWSKENNGMIDYDHKEIVNDISKTRPCFWFVLGFSLILNIYLHKSKGEQNQMYTLHILCYLVMSCFNGQCNLE